MISLTSSQEARTKPPKPRLVLYDLARSGFWLMYSQAEVGDMVARASRHMRIRCPRTMGYFTRCAEYTYHEYDAPRGQPRGSWLGKSGRVRG